MCVCVCVWVGMVTVFKCVCAFGVACMYVCVCVCVCVRARVVTPVSEACNAHARARYRCTGCEAIIKLLKAIKKIPQLIPNRLFPSSLPISSPLCISTPSLLLFPRRHLRRVI